MHQRDIQRLWELWCEGAESYLHERAGEQKQKRTLDVGRSDKKHSGEEQQLPLQMRVHKTIGLAGKWKILSDSFSDMVSKPMVLVLRYGLRCTCGKNATVGHGVVA